ncbi:MAG: hypothetical protein RLZZ360_594 [Candidatus Parcubacteria bacterium]|jgi:hypothetical protein
MTAKTINRGFLMIYVLVFASVFMVILTSFVTFIVTQSRLIEQRMQFEQSGQIAEAGLDYYKWYLAHNPNSTTTSLTGVYNDPELGAIGEYQLTLASTSYCGTVMSRQVSSRGHTYKDPSVSRTLSARYARPNVAEYSFIINNNVWAGDDRIINGPYHSNGGVRMDGTNNSSVTSGQTDWACTPSFGCSPTTTQNGVFTSTVNANASLFSFPSAPVNFGGITVDLAEMETKARSNGIFLDKLAAGNYGYQIRFNSNNTITVNRVTGVQTYWGYTTENGWLSEQHVITATSSVANYTIPTSCPLIIAQDKVWLQGTVPGKVTLAASFATSTTINPSIILANNITYTSPTTSGLLAIAEQDVLIGVNVPNDMNLNGIFIAQNGRYGRNYYCTSCSVSGNSRGLPSSLDPYVIRNSETHNGTIVSNGRVGTQWTSGGVTTSGFQNRYTSYDRNLVESPPPFIPETSDVYDYSDWRDTN